MTIEFLFLAHLRYTFAMKATFYFLFTLLLTACATNQVGVTQLETDSPPEVENQQPIIPDPMVKTTNNTIGNGYSSYKSKWGFSFEYPSVWNVFDSNLEGHWVKSQHLQYLKLVPYEASDDMPSEEEWVSEILITFFDFQHPVKSKKPPYESINLYMGESVDINQWADIYRCEDLVEKTIGDKKFTVGEHTFFNPDLQKEFTKKCYFYVANSKGVLVDAFIEQAGTEDFFHILNTFQY